MNGYLAPLGGAVPQNLPRQMRRELAGQQHTALVHARKIEAVAACTELAIFSVASLTNLEAQLVASVPLAERRLESLVNTATAVMGAQIARLTWEL